jgi:hypothetical protein
LTEPKANYFPHTVVCNLGDLATVPEPFYIGQVTENDVEANVMQVRWYCPTLRSKEKKTKYSEMNYELELIAIQQRGRQNGAARYRMEERHQQIAYNEVSHSISLLCISCCISILICCVCSLFDKC